MSRPCSLCDTTLIRRILEFLSSSIREISVKKGGCWILLDYEVIGIENC